MARVSPVEPCGASPEVSALFERLRSDLGIEPNNFFKTLAHQPELLEPIMGLTRALLEGGALDRRLKEWVILHVARLHRCPYVFEAHALALSRELMSDLLARHRPPTAVEPDETERVAIRYANELLTRGASSRTFAALQARFSEAEIVELTVLIGFYRMVCHFVEALQTPVDRLRFLTP